MPEECTLEYGNPELTTDQQGNCSHHSLPFPSPWAAFDLLRCLMRGHGGPFLYSPNLLRSLPRRLRDVVSVRSSLDVGGAIHLILVLQSCSAAGIVLRWGGFPIPGKALESTSGGSGHVTATNAGGAIAATATHGVVWSARHRHQGGRQERACGRLQGGESQVRRLRRAPREARDGAS